VALLLSAFLIEFERRSALHASEEHPAPDIHLNMISPCLCAALQSALAALMANKPSVNLTLPSLPQVDLSGLLAALDKNVSLAAPQVRLPPLLLLGLVACFRLYTLWSLLLTNCGHV
jgi:hypothetical protein